MRRRAATSAPRLAGYWPIAAAGPIRAEVLSKLPKLQSGRAGATPQTVSCHRSAPVAQGIEHGSPKAGVAGSNPAGAASPRLQRRRQRPPCSAPIHRFRRPRINVILPRGVAGSSSTNCRRSRKRSTPTSRSTPSATCRPRARREVCGKALEFWRQRCWLLFMSSRLWIGWVAVGIGVCAVVSAFAVSSTQVGQGFAFGFGAFIAFFGALSVLAHNRAPDHWGLLVVGLAMFVAPFRRQRL